MIVLSIFSHFLSGKSSHNPTSQTKKYYNFVIFAFAILTIVFVAANLILTSSKLGFTPQQISIYYLGDEATFIQPKSFAGILETATTHFAVMAIYLITLAHFVFFTEFRWKVLLVFLIFSSAFTNIISAFSIRFISAEFAYLKILSFWILQASMLYASYLIIRYSVNNEPDMNKRGI